MTTEAPIKYFKTQEEWAEWMAKNFTNEEGIWVRMYKKATGKPSLSHGDALDVALCYGWIDGQVKKDGDPDSWLQKFTPRRARSIWSKINIGHIERLTKAGLMKPSGIAAVEHAKKTGAWDQAYDSPKDAKVPEDFVKAVSKDKKALEFFNSLNKTNLFAIFFQLQTAKKPETRERRFNKLLDMMKKGEKLQ